MAVVQESSVPAIQQFNLPMMDPSVRPKSALARGVQIRSYKESCINPEPIMIEETDVLLEEYLSPRRLRALTGVDDLEQVTSLEMKVDTSETSLGNFGSMLPSLSQLKLSNSIIASIRDLGSSLDSLRVLWMGRCGLQELDGVSSMANLRELYLSYNEISELGPCSMLENIQILDLEGNNIEEISQVEFLALCSNLSNLTLDGNPICVTPSPDKAEPSYDYREAVIKALPQLKILDDEPIFKNTNKSKMSSLRPPKKKKQQVSVFEDDWALINELMAEGDLLNNEETDSPVPLARPGTAFRPTTGYTPGSVLRPTTAKRPMTMARPTTSRPMTSRPTTARPMTGRPGTARPGSSDNTDLSTDDASQLTLGTVVCGNPSKALRARRKQTIQQPVVQTPPKLFSEYRSEPEKPYDQAAAVRDDKNLEGIFEELSEWRLHNSEVQAEREKENVPQVLRIDEEIVVSSDGEESDTEILYSALGPEPQDNLDSIYLDSAGHSDRSSLGVSTDRSSDFDTSKLEQDFMAEMERCSRLMYTEELDRENSAINRHSQRVTGHGSARVTGSGSGSGSAVVKSATRGTERQRGAESHNGANRLSASGAVRARKYQPATKSESHLNGNPRKRSPRHDESFEAASDSEESRTGTSSSRGSSAKGHGSDGFRVLPGVQRRSSAGREERQRESSGVVKDSRSMRMPAERRNEPMANDKAKPVIRSPTSPAERSPQSSSVRSRGPRVAMALPSQPRIARQADKAQSNSRH